MKSYIIAFALLTNYFVAIGQQSDTVDSKNNNIKYGLLLGLNQKVPINGQIGLSTGLSIDFRLSNKLFFRSQALISFLPDTALGKNVVANVIEIPIHFLFKPLKNKMTPTFSAGTNYKYDISNSSLALFGEIAFGLETKLKYFTIEPVLKLSYGQKMQLIYLTLIFKN